MAVNNPIAANQAITKKCDVCLRETPVPPGIDLSQVRCPDADSMWHATYSELIIRCNGTLALIMAVVSQTETSLVTMRRNADAITETVEAVQKDAAKIRQALGD